MAETKPKLEHWRPNHISGGWYRRHHEEDRAVASVFFERGQWYGAAEHPDGNSGVLMPPQPADDLARAAVDEKLKELVWTVE